MGNIMKLIKNFLLLTIICFFMTSANANLDEVFGNAGSGDQCQSDYQCESLCCDQTKGICNPHDPSAVKPVFCSKKYGEMCITSQFCKSEFIQTCKLIKLGLDLSGKVTCTLRCPAVETLGSCTNGYCQAPKIPPVPAFDPANPDCTNAVDP